jgi:hypothetical protein
VHLYFDLEYKRGLHPVLINGEKQNIPLNSGVNGDALIAVVLFHVADHIKRRFGCVISAENVVHLESSTDVKFSRHLIIHLPDGSMFRDTAHAGEFVMAMIDELQAQRSTSPEVNALWIETNKPMASFSAKSGPEKTLLGLVRQRRR